MRRTLLGIVLLFATATVSYGQAPATSDYFPLKKGSKWVYKLNEIEVTVEVGDYNAETKETKLRTLSNGKEVASEAIVIDPKGIYRTRINTTPIEPRVAILQLDNGKPVPKGAKWSVDSKVQQQEIKGSFEVKDDKATLKVPAGDMTNVISVEGSKLSVAGTETTVRYWFAPNKGIVKLSYTINNQEAVLELKSYEEAK